MKPLWLWMPPVGCLIWIISPWLVSACGPISPPAPPPTPGPAEFAGPLRSPSTMPNDFVWRQQLVAEFRDQRQTFSAVVEKRGDSLTIVGLTPFNSKAFVLRQQGTGTAFQSYIDREMPFPPRNILLDFQRAWFPVAKRPPLPDGTHTFTNGEEDVQEIWQGKRLRVRLFSRRSGQPPGQIRIQYQRYNEAGLPERVVLDNGWFGYRLTVSTVDTSSAR